MSGKKDDAPILIETTKGLIDVTLLMQTDAVLYSGDEIVLVVSTWTDDTTEVVKQVESVPAKAGV